MVPFIMGFPPAPPGAGAGAGAGAAAGVAGAGAAGVGAPPAAPGRGTPAGAFIISIVPLNFGAVAPLSLKPHLLHVLAVSWF